MQNNNKQMVDIATHPVNHTLPTDRQIDMLYKMRLVRAFEEAAEQQYFAGKVHGTMHLYIGEEAAAVGAISATEARDQVTSTHRGHGHAVAKGQDVRRMMAELLAKETGVCRGRGGSMHMADVELGNLGANGIVSGGMASAVGAALSSTCSRPAAWCCASLAMARPTTATSMKRSTWLRSGNCRSCLSAKTTNMP